MKGICINMKKYILYGTGGEAERFLYQNQSMVKNIAFCIDRKKKERFYEWDVYQFEPRLIKKHKVIIAAGEENIYVEIKRNLTAAGFTEWVDFIWSRAFNRKIVIINANCHGVAIKKYLEQSPVFCNEYFIYPIPAIHLNKDKEISQELLKHVNIYIHQDIREDNVINYKLSDNYIQNQLNKDVIDICIPNFVGMARWMYPNLGKLEKIIESMQGPLYVLYRDEILDEALLKCNSYEEIKKFWLEYEYDDNYYDETFRICMSKLKCRENNWDINISKYIENNYKSIPCFTDVDHPSKYVMGEVGRQVAEILNITDIDDTDYEPNLGLQVPILNSVSKYFKFNFKLPKEQRKSILGKRITSEIDDYIKAYLWWYHGKIFSNSIL